MLEDYKIILQESKRARFAGIMIPVYAVVMLFSIIFLTNNNILWICVTGSVSLLMLISLIMLSLERMRKDMSDLKRCKDSYTSKYGEEPLTFKQMRKKYKK